MHTVAVVGAQGAASLGPVQLRGRVAVVDEQELTALQPRGGVADPSVEGEADLGGLPGLEADSLLVEPGGKLRRRRRAEGGREAAVGCERDESLEERPFQP